MIDYSSSTGFWLLPQSSTKTSFRCHVQRKREKGKTLQTDATHVNLHSAFSVVCRPQAADCKAAAVK